MAELLDDPVAVGSPAHGGFVVGRVGSVVTLVRHAVPGEVVRVAVTARRSRVWFADAVEVIEPARTRVRHVWPEAGPGGVGGGDLGHVAPAAQLDWKTAVLDDSLRRIGGEQVAGDVAAAEGSTAVRAVADPAQPGTRTRVELTGAADGRLGMHRYRGDEVLPLARLPLADPRLDAPALLSDLRVDPGARVRAVVGSGTGPDAEPRLLVDGRALRGGPRVAETVPTVLGPLDLTVAADGFWQVHHAAPATLVEVVLALAAGVAPRLPDPPAWLPDEAGTAHGSDHAAGQRAPGERPPGERPPGERDAAAGPAGTDEDARADKVRADAVRAGLDGTRVLELYSGAGLLSAALARAVGPDGGVLTLEGAPGAVDDARANLVGTPWARPLSGAVDAGSVAALGREPEWAAGGTVVLDPPRAGARADVMSAVADLGPRRIVHVACDPAALARDLAAARSAGYVAERVVALDLFAHTHHLEAVVSLVRA
ncbi:class I SAM-dependent RNA methyltransferase [Georgenia sp. Z1344]|uniref:class I SAM-dependent RNA methyltransferase n=1 Tax=Georgenia sp. Z1344 TaxID=3416706 RepID=UPI003CEF584A